MTGKIGVVVSPVSGDFTEELFVFVFAGVVVLFSGVLLAGVPTMPYRLKCSATKGNGNSANFV